jgi:hypothetical protein
MSQLDKLAVSKLIQTIREVEDLIKNSDTLPTEISGLCSITLLRQGGGKSVTEK